MNILDRLFEARDITGPDGSVYMRRWYIFRTKRIALFVHKFVRSDYDKALHNHPWNFLVIPIWRGYIEHSDRPWLGWDGKPVEKRDRIPIVRRVYPIIGTRFRRAEYRHRVELLTIPSYSVGVSCGMTKVTPTKENLPAWSLFFRFRKRQHWGFFCPQGFVPFQADKKDHCNDN